MSQTGTKALMGQWLMQHKKMTYSKYSQLPTAKKLEIQKEYGSRKAPSSLPIVVESESVPQE